MVSIHPQLLSYKITVNKEKYESLINEGFLEEEALFIFYNMRSLFSGNFNKHLEKIRFLREIGLENVIFRTPKNLIQSNELTYARYCFLTSIGAEISADNFSKLFYDNEWFEKKYGKSRDQLLNMYDYNDYLKEKERNNKLNY